MQTFIQRIKQKIKHNSPLRLIHDGLVKIGIKITPFYLVEEGIKEPIPAYDTYAKQYEGYYIRQLNSDHTDNISSLAERPLPRERIEKRFTSGDICLAIFDAHDQLAGFTWCSTQLCSYDGMSFPIRDDEAYLYDAYIVMAYRGKRLAPFMRYQSYKLMLSQGRKRLYSISEAINNQSLKFKQKLNAEIVFLGLRIKLFNRLRWCFMIKKMKEFDRGF